MGLLTDPTAGQGKLRHILLKYYVKVCILLYIAGVAWFCVLAYPPINSGTYFSENALLPGLVKSEFRDEVSAKLYYDELIDEMKKYDDAIPYPWLLAKFRQIGLDTYTHNFTLNYPLGKPQKFYGKNVYGILRAARAASTEALVMSVPYRPPANVHLTTAPSIAIMLAFAKFANKEKYWSKDIIFLITEHEQLGVQAWLEAYYDVTCGEKGILDHGDLRGRGGAIQAAINLELHDINIGRVDVKIEGLNGQLPNLDLFNLATRMCTKEGVHHTFKNRANKTWRDPYKDWLYSFQTLLAMVSTQATGVPNGNHGLFHRFGIQALTLEGFSSPKNKGYNTGFLTIGRILEGIFRSLNNLLERFHQSFFFYMLPATDKFISIGLYFPAVCLLVGALFIKACAKWCQIYNNPINIWMQEDEPEKPEKDEKSDLENVKLLQVGIVLMFTHAIGLVLMNSPHIITKLGLQWGYSTDVSTYMGFGAASLILLTTPLFIKLRKCYKSMAALNIAALLELGTVLICLSMYNYSFGILCAAFCAPFALLIMPSGCRLCSVAHKMLWLLAHPLVVLSATVFAYTFYFFSNEPFYENIIRALGATQQALVFGIVDSAIYGNWLYKVITAIFIPNWLCFWCVLFSAPKPNTSDVNNISLEKKTK